MPWARDTLHCRQTQPAVPERTRLVKGLERALRYNDRARRFLNRKAAKRNRLVAIRALSTITDSALISMVD